MQIESYDLDLDIDSKRASVSGVVGVTVTGSESPLRLDASEMEITSVTVNGRKAAFKHYGSRGLLSVSGVPRRRSLVRVAYNKMVSDEVIFGLYKSKYGKEYILATDFEPAEARKAFPCKDHPAYKAVFRLTLTVDGGLKAISNTAVASRKRVAGGRTRLAFDPTPKMSTYLLFFAVGRMDELRRRLGRREVIVAARQGEAGKGSYIAANSALILKDYEKYFGIPYPLKKLHIVALPEYHTGAMENWGAISSREAYVLLDENSGTFDRRNAVMAMAHEIGHQWFGDLVTMKWWDDMWLNESFATFMEHKMVDRLHHDWDTWATFLRLRPFMSQVRDALSTTHPIEVKVRTPEESNLLIDNITYGKGASVLRMMEAYLGEETFRKGVTAYLKKFRYSNATGRDLWRAIGKASGRPVSKIMATWITKPGFPLVKVKHYGGKLVLSQSRFQLNGEEPESTWPIPLTLEVNGERKSFLFDRREMRIDLPRLTSLNVNPDHAGFYSVLGDDGILRMVRENFHALGPYDKGGLMNDLFLFLLAGKVDPSRYFDFVSLCSEEKEHLVLEVVADHLQFLHTVAGEAEAVRSAAATFATSQLRRLGLAAAKGEDPSQSILRETISTLAARVETEFSGELVSMFQSFDEVDPNLKEAVATAYSLEGGGVAHDRLESLVKSTSSEIDRSRLYMAMAASKDQDLVSKTLNLGISGEVSRSDSLYPIVGAARNFRARDPLWNWLKAKYDTLWKLYAGSQQIAIFYELTVPRCGVGRMDDAKRFLSGKMKDGGQAYERALESLEINARLRTKLLAA